MIKKQDILDRAAEWMLDPSVVEKDYVLGWLLAAISQHPIAGNLWVFKGGTSIKKCYFETYRFSEDLDFSLLPEAPYTQDEIIQILNNLTDMVTELSGIIFSRDLTIAHLRQDKLHRPTLQGKICYRGPLRQLRSFPRVLFDLTNNEPVLGVPVCKPIIHPYPDVLPENTGVTNYCLEELLAEKTRALYERTRPRDLYDVIYLCENKPETLNLTILKDYFHKKCLAKNFNPPTAQEIYQRAVESKELFTEWNNMLAHQMSAVPYLPDLLDRLPGLIKWI